MPDIEYVGMKEPVHIYSLLRKPLFLLCPPLYLCLYSFRDGANAYMPACTALARNTYVLNFRDPLHRYLLHTREMCSGFIGACLVEAHLQSSRFSRSICTWFVSVDCGVIAELH